MPGRALEPGCPCPSRPCPSRPGPAACDCASESIGRSSASLSRSLSPLCSFLRFLQLFFSQSSGPQLCFSGLLRSLLVRYRCPRGMGGPACCQLPGRPGMGLPAGRSPGLKVSTAACSLVSAGVEEWGQGGRRPGRQAGLLLAPEDAVRLGAALPAAVPSVTR